MLNSLVDLGIELNIFAPVDYAVFDELIEEYVLYFSIFYWPGHRYQF